jgi:tricorn protease interacting factor F2/3
MDGFNPTNYKIHLEPDLPTFTFTGITEIELDARQPVDEIMLNAKELAFWHCKVRINNLLVQCPFSFDPRKEELRISLPEKMAGHITLNVAYLGKINDKMTGFYRSKYRVGGTDKYCAVTQFEESDARRAFPCFDHPAKKATFDVELVIDEGLVAISNGPKTAEKPVGNKRKVVTFQRTPKMSTYLLFFGVGEFEFIENPGEVLVRAATMPGMIKHATYGLQFGRKALGFCEDYYGLKYPLPKLDLIAIPDFAAGAMENWGAITFRENLLLHFPAITSRAGEQRICEVIAHEIAHQWFGNLVTPSDWKYLWLNESFATYFGYGVVVHFHPEWDIWDQFLHGQTDTALNRDSLKETFPIELPGGEHVAINASTAPILYNKGGSILRQVAAYVGEANFKKGLRHYLEKHQYGCAASPDLWEALEEISDKPVTTMMKSWIEQPGLPLVETARDGDKILLTQTRFTFLPSESEQAWVIPVTVRVFYENGDSRKKTALLTARSASIDLERNAVAYKVNHGQSGFYRVKYRNFRNLHELGKHVESKTLVPEDRWGLQNDLYALVRGCQAPLKDYLTFLSYYEHEDAFLPLISIADNLFHAYLVFERGQRNEVVSAARSLFENALSRIGYEPHGQEKPTVSILRDHILMHLVAYGSVDTTQFALGKFSSLLKGEEVHSDIMKSIMKVGAWNGDMKTFEWFDQRFKSSESEHERMNILSALGSFRDDEVVKRVQAYVLSDVPQRNLYIPIDSLCTNPAAMPLMWEWYVSNLGSLEQIHPIQYERVIEAIVPVCGLGREEEIRAFFEDYMNQKTTAKDVIRLSLERLEINSRMRAS